MSCDILHVKFQIKQDSPRVEAYVISIQYGKAISSLILIQCFPQVIYDSNLKFSFLIIKSYETWSCLSTTNFTRIKCETYVLMMQQILQLVQLELKASTSTTIILDLLKCNLYSIFFQVVCYVPHGNVNVVKIISSIHKLWNQQALKHYRTLWQLVSCEFQCQTFIVEFLNQVTHY